MVATDWDKPRRVDIGFQGGQDLTLRLSEGAYDKLRDALQNGPRWHTVESEDSEVAVDLSQVVFVRLDTELHRVGF